MKSRVMMPWLEITKFDWKVAETVMFANDPSYEIINNEIKL